MEINTTSKTSLEWKREDKVGLIVIGTHLQLRRNPLEIQPPVGFKDSDKCNYVEY